MNDLKALISTFTSEEQQKFTTYLEKKNKRSDTKNIQLFKYIAKEDLTTQAICSKIYGIEKTNAYHALRKRLYQSILDFFANMSLHEENSNDMQIIKYILAARKCLLHKQYKVAYKILDKAESQATEHYLFPILNEIYHTKIQYAYGNTSIDLDALIIKFKQNQKNHQLEDELNIVYAKVRRTLNNITYKGSVLDFQTILDHILKEHDISLNESLSFKSLYQLMSIIGLSAFVTNDYLKTEPFLINTYNSILKKRKKDKSVYYHIQILYLIANTLFRSKKFKQSLEYLNVMHQEMQKKHKKYYNTFKLKYVLLQSLNLNYSNNPEKAIALLTPLTKIKHPDTESMLDIHLGLIVFHCQQGDYIKANRIFTKFYHTDQWYVERAGKAWVIKKNLTEILLLLELEYIDLLESRLLSFKRTYYNYLKSIKQERVITYISLVEHYYKNPENVTTKAFKDTVENAFEWLSKEKEDIFVMSFYAWLKSKMENQDLYKTTLKLIENSIS